MDIQIEDEVVVRNLDVVAAAGGPFIAHVIDIPNVIVMDDTMTIIFVPVQQHPMISGIEIFQSVQPVRPDNDDDVTVTVTPTAVPSVDIETLSPIVSVAPVTSFPTASPLALPPNSPPIKLTNDSSFHDLVINCGGTFGRLFKFCTSMKFTLNSDIALFLFGCLCLFHFQQDLYIWNIADDTIGVRTIFLPADQHIV